VNCPNATIRGSSFVPVVCGLQLLLLAAAAVKLLPVLGCATQGA
jgi:hypothetical protein